MITALLAPGLEQTSGMSLCSKIRWLGGNKSQGMHTRSRGRFCITDFYKGVSFQGRNRLSVKVWYKLSEVLRILRPL